ncbi:hypothetical protein WKH57_11220 [Niallia taxi]|uniref:hypothetical protein n=1 Tax=Niallia taxi TaxID=2499688 RepID=UPI003174E136
MMYLKLLLVLVIFANVIEQWIPLFSYFDEMLTVIFLLMSLIKYSVISKKMKQIFMKSEIIVIIFVFIILFLAIISSYTSDVKNTLFLQVYSLFASFKLIILYLSCRILFIDIKRKTFESFGKFALKQTYWFLYVIYLLFFLNLIFNIFQKFDHRFGMDSVAYGFSHPAKFSSIVILQVAINLYFTAKLKNRISYRYLLLSFFLLLTSGRIAAIAFFIMLFVVLISFRYFRKFVISGIIIGISGLLLVSNQKIINTFFDLEQPRGVLLSTAFKIGVDYFPLGSGQGTFGSHASRLNYSPMYYKYGISNEWGLSPQFSQFITDSYWAMMIGEFGFIGAFLVLIILLILYYNAYITKKGIIGLIISIPLMYLILTSFIDTIIVSNSVLSMVIVTVIIISIEKNSNLNLNNLEK